MQKMIKPQKAAFLIKRNLLAVLILFFVFLLIGFILTIFFDSFLVWTLVVSIFVLASGFNLINSLVAFSKREYVFLEDRIVQKGGNLFSDSETELLVKNITHVKMRLPFIEHAVFKTGRVRVESAGSASSEIFLESVDKTSQKYKQISALMEKNGFELSRKSLKFRDKPVILGVLFEVFKNILGILVFIVFFLGEFVADIHISQAVDFNWTRLGSFVLIILAVFVYSILRQFIAFLDLLKRKYFIYEDVIVYKDGFLNKNYAFIPFSNLSDSNLDQSLISRIFGIYDVKLSCQGGDSEILFKNLRKGKEMNEVLDSLINRAERKSLKAKDKLESESKTKGETKSNKEKSTIKNIYDKNYIDEFKMQPFRSLFGFLLILGGVVLIFIPLIIFVPLALAGLLPVLVVFVTSSLVGIIPVFATTYYVKSSKIEQAYNFLSNKKIEFSFEKITSVELKKNFIDKWFKTLTIEFNSIGSNQPLILRNIRADKKTVQKLLLKVGIRQLEKSHKIGSKYSLGNEFRAYLFQYLILLVCFGFLLVSFGFSFGLEGELLEGFELARSIFSVLLVAYLVLLLIIIVYRHFYYKKMSLVFFKDSLRFEKGIFFKHYYFSLLENVKDITTKKYPFSKMGEISFNLVGERLVRKQGSKKSVSLVSNGFNFAFVENIDTKDDLVDYILGLGLVKTNLDLKELEFDREPRKDFVLKGSPHLVNSILGILLFFIIIDSLVLIFVKVAFVSFSILILSFLFIILFILSVKVRTYLVQEDRVLYRRGLVYKKQTSIIFDKIDFIEKDKGLLNQIFKTGNVIINTTGSTMAELILKNVSEPEKWYEEIKKRYKN
ncbi:MAG: PH domain-containing protein [Candidatus Moranbacteria bacterium]|nr:PH domain-containing protein [Candidatus Moranbacteria bacterium]